jgi:hypothetical protein
MKLLVGTTKGLISYQQKSSGWVLEKVHFPGLSVSMLFFNAQTSDIWVGLAIKHWGPKIFISSDEGKNWTEKTVPKYPQEAEIKPGKPATLQLIWSAAYQPEKERLWVGTEPGGLFYSDDRGETFHLNQALWDHP